VEGATGSGKSTQLPQYLESLFSFEEGMIVCTQPRKIAAVSTKYNSSFPASNSLHFIFDVETKLQYSSI